MKNIKRIIAWIMLSIFVQCAGLFYLNNFFFKDDANVISHHVTPQSTPTGSKADIKIPDDATHVSVSYDGKYLAYYVGDTLKVVTTAKGDTKTVQFGTGTKVSYYKWLPDVNSMIIAEKQTSSKGDYLKFSNYDVSKDKKKEIKDDRNDNPNYIYLPDKKSEVEDIELSTLTNIIYVKIGHKGNRNSIYRINVMAEMEKAKINSYLTGNIVIFPHEDKLAYEDLTYHKVYVSGMSGYVNIMGASVPYVLGVDGDDNLYVGQADGDKVKKIYYGNIKDGTNSWKSIDLPDSVDKKDIFITDEGKVYVNDNLKGIVTDMATGQETSYKGQFIQMYHDGIVSKRSGVVYKTVFKS